MALSDFIYADVVIGILAIVFGIIAAVLLYAGVKMGVLMVLVERLGVNIEEADGYSKFIISAILVTAALVAIDIKVFLSVMAIVAGVAAMAALIYAIAKLAVVFFGRK
jgi:hypothetical protein